LLLADLGADVIHIEGPSAPDPARGLIANAPNGLNAYVESLNRGKRAISLDLHDPRGKEALYRLVKTADVFVSNLRAKSLQRLGADYEALREHNPRLVYALASGYGAEGPDAGLPSMDLLGQARGGIMMSMALAAGDETPRALPPGSADQVGAITLAFGIMAALYHRERTGEGQELHSSLLGSQMAVLTPWISAVLFGGLPPSTPAARNPTWRIYKAGDERWLALAMIDDSFWPGVCGVLERPHWLTDERYSNLPARQKNYDQVSAEMSAIFATQARAHWLRRFAEADLLATPVQTYDELAEDAQAMANGYITELRRDGAAPVRVVGPPVSFSRTPASVRGLAPEFDQHTEEVLLEAGYGWPELEALRRQGVIGQPE
jgi:crotonobetainyl-CoA:carnitine CoA-transferase CaiB-like acyl-CoA transferase